MNELITIFVLIPIISTLETKVSSEPLFLTKFIDADKIEEARKAALVQHESFLNTTSFSGFFTINQTSNNLFIWFCPSESDYVNDPLILWLQGGPGASSLFGLFLENGPFKILSNGRISLNKFSWSKTHNVLYIDNPAGSGFSFTNNENIENDENQIAFELYEVIQQFFKLFPEIRGNELFLTGESYAGKYITMLSNVIMLKNEEVAIDSRINLVGMAVGNGFFDPIAQYDIGEFAYQHGLIDSNTKKTMDILNKNRNEFIFQRKFKEALNENTIMLSLLHKATGFTNFFNYLYNFIHFNLEFLLQFLQKSEIREAIHVGNKTFNLVNNNVTEVLKKNTMQSVPNFLPTLLENYRILFYNGQLDIRLPYTTMVKFLETLKFNAEQDYKTAERKIWRVGHNKKEIAGYVKVAGNLTELMVRNAGHMVSMDQPKLAFDMMNIFTRNKSFA